MNLEYSTSTIIGHIRSALPTACSLERRGRPLSPLSGARAWTRGGGERTFSFSPPARHISLYRAVSPWCQLDRDSERGEREGGRERERERDRERETEREKEKDREREYICE
eukprot:scaffold14091_cov28-Tisochrysis_lutea.AAC.10